MLKALIVDDARVIRFALARSLRAMGIEVVEAVDGPAAIALFRKERPGLVLIDVEMPGMNGFEVVKAMRELAGKDWVPIIFLSGMDYEAGTQLAIEAGGDDFLGKPPNPVVLEAKIRALRRLDALRSELVAVTHQLQDANDRLQKLSQEDGLTGLGNRRHFDLLLDREIAAARRERRPLSLLLGDVDHFKAYNDTYGHVAGDECLRQVGSAIARSCQRATDVPVRYGGEEFALILPDTDENGAHAVASNTLAGIRGLGIPHTGSHSAAVVTLSLGVCTLIPDETTTAASFIAAADAALYRAKAEGRNRMALAA